MPPYIVLGYIIRYEWFVMSSQSLLWKNK
jgi:hypothetical protein